MFTDTQTLPFAGMTEQTQTTAELIAGYLYYAENVRDMAPSTLKGRRAYLKQFYLFVQEEDVDILSLTNQVLDKFFVELANSVSVHTKRPITTGTVNTCKRAVKAFLIWCMEYKELPLKVKIKEIREAKRIGKHPKLLTHKQIKMVISKTRNKQDKLMISVMYEAGLRISELTDMKIEHLRGKTLDVVGKGQKHRITFITTPLAKQLHAWMEENGWEEGHVFRPQMHTDGTTGYLHTDSVRARIKKLFKDIIGVDMHPHLLRHAFALRLLKQGCGLRSIQKLLGHSNIQTTMTYLGIDDSFLEKEYTKYFGVTVYA